MIQTDPSLAMKALPPAGRDMIAEQPCLRDAGTDGISVFCAPPGYLLTEGLAGALGTGHPLWLRLGVEDRDPAVLLTTAADALRPTGFGARTVARMRGRPGPVYGWAPLFDSLAADLAEGITRRGGLVVEHLHHAIGPGLTMLGARVLPVLRRAGRPVVLVSHRELDGCPLPAAAVQHSVRHLRLSPSVVARLVSNPAPPVDPRVVEQCAGQAAAVAAVRAARIGFGPASDRTLADAAGTVDDLLVRVARLFLTTTPDAERRRLGLATVLEYAGSVPAESGPWWQRLDPRDGTAGTGPARLRTVWRDPLRIALRPDGLPGRDDLRAEADRLARTGSPGRAIDLYLNASAGEDAARLIAGQSERMMDLGQWRTLDGWLARLDREVLADHPLLVQVRGEITAAGGDAAGAQAWFDLASARFVARGDPAGACGTMLAASTLAAGSRDLATARARAASARSLADVADRPDCRLWTAWQLAAVELLDGDDDASLLALARTANGQPDDATRDRQPDRIALTTRLSRDIVGMRRERERYRAALTALERRERETLGRLVRAVAAPPDPAAVAAAGWSATPLPVRLRGLGAGIRAGPAGTDRLPGPRPPSADEGPVPVAPTRAIIVQLLGPLRVAVGDTPVEDHLGGRARSLLAYLVTHREPWPAREMIAEALWPGTSPERGRNCLHVAVHGLRRALRAGTDHPVVIHSGAGYRLHPAVRLWLDVEDFDRHASSGRRGEHDGASEAAIAEYEQATALYRGDFLADEPYEEWPAPTRDRLRFTHMDVLDRLAGLHFAADRYAMSADLCARLIELDPCREDTRRRLMRCHSRLGRPHLALLEFRACVRVLADELRVEPAPETVELYRRIRRHEPV